MTLWKVAQDGTIVVPASIEIDVFHYAVHAKLGFQTSHHVDVGNGATMSISLKTPATGTQIHMLPEYWVEASANFKVREACTVDADGTLHSASNRNRIGTPPDTTCEDYSTGSWTAGNVTKGATLNGVGTIINGGGEGQEVGIGKFSGGSAEASHEWLLKPATIYMFEMLNNTVSNNEMYLELNWFEVPDA